MQRIFVKIVAEDVEYVQILYSVSENVLFLTYKAHGRKNCIFCMSLYSAPLGVYLSVTRCINNINLGDVYKRPVFQAFMGGVVFTYFEQYINDLPRSLQCTEEA